MREVIRRAYNIGGDVGTDRCDRNSQEAEYRNTHATHCAVKQRRIKTSGRRSACDMSKHNNGVPQRARISSFENRFRRARDDDRHRAEQHHRGRKTQRLPEHLLPLTAAKAREIWNVQTERRPETNHARE